MGEKKEMLGFIKKASFWRGLLLIALVISMIPIFAITPYNHSCADDYSYGYRAHAAYVQTKTPVEIIKAVVETVTTTYQKWQGTYSAIALFSIQPAVWGEQYYIITTYILLAFTLWGIFSFFRGWIGKTYGRKDIADIAACCVSILFLQELPSPVEGLFWWNGASYYMLWNALMLVFISQLIIAMQARRFPPWKCVILSLLGALLGGANLITTLLTLELTTLFFIYAIVKRNCWKQVGIVFLFMAAGFFVNVLAPGNDIRQQASERVSPFLAILKSFYAALIWSYRWTTPLLIALLAFFLPFSVALQPAMPKRTRFPLICKLGILFCLFASMFTPSIFAGTDIGTGRIQNIRLLFWIIACVVSEVLVVHELMRLLQRKNPKFRLEALQSWFTAKKALLLVCVCLLAVGLTAARRIAVYGYDEFTSTSAAESLLSGTAQEYDRIADERLKLLLSSEKSVTLPAFQRAPLVLYFDDITRNSNDWKNRSVARYYGKDIVYLEPNGMSGYMAK